MEYQQLLTIIHPGQVLFGLAVLFYGSAFTLAFVLPRNRSVVKPLTGILFLVLFFLLGTVAIEFSSAATPSYTHGTFASLSEALSTHRWLLFQLPILLTITSLFVLLTYGETLINKHARVYRTAFLVCVSVSFASLLMILFESML